jgi:hypothetical protein
MRKCAHFRKISRNLVCRKVFVFWKICAKICGIFCHKIEQQSKLRLWTWTWILFRIEPKKSKSHRIQTAKLVERKTKKYCKKKLQHARCHYAFRNNSTIYDPVVELNNQIVYSNKSTSVCMKMRELFSLLPTLVC